MQENKMFITGLILFIGGILGAGLFAISQSISDSYSLLEKTPDTICGVISFLFLIVSIVGIFMTILQIVKYPNRGKNYDKK